MEVKIYCIEDCDGLKYVGSTKQKLNVRLIEHRHDKKKNLHCSSKQLKLEDCCITELEKCNEENRMEREKYWINKIDCVNLLKLNGLDKYNRREYLKKYNEKNKEYFKEYHKYYYEKNKDREKEKARNNYIQKVVKNCLDDLITQVEDLI